MFLLTFVCSSSFLFSSIFFVFVFIFVLDFSFVFLLLDILPSLLLLFLLLLFLCPHLCFVFNSIIRLLYLLHHLCFLSCVIHYNFKRSKCYQGKLWTTCYFFLNWLKKIKIQRIDQMTNGCSPFLINVWNFCFFNLLKQNAKEFLVHSLVLIICNFNPKKEILDNKTEQICFYHLSPACLWSTCVLYFNNDIIKADLFMNKQMYKYLLAA